MTTIIIRIIIVQIDKLLKNCFSLLFVDKKPGKIKGVLQKEILQTLSDQFHLIYVFFQIF